MPSVITSARALMNHARERLREMRYPSVTPADDSWYPQVALSPAGKPFRVVVLGGDIGGLSQARSFYEAFGVRASVLAAAPLPIHGDSKAWSIRYEPRLGDINVVRDELNTIAARDHSPLLVLSSFDIYVEFLSRLTPQLDSRIAHPHAPHDMLARLTNKARFAELCQSAGIGHPDTVIIDTREETIPSVDHLGWPVVVKPADASLYDPLDFDGKEKVYFAADAADLHRIVRLCADAGYAGELVAQRRVPGSDAQMRIVTTYFGEGGRMDLCAYGRELIEEHDPYLRGNPAAILTEEAPLQIRRNLEAFARASGWRGVANFDIKMDRDGTARFFEINPRLGRSNYYLNVCGVNPVKFLVRTLIDRQRPLQPLLPSRRGLYTVVPLSLAIAYASGAGVRRAVMEAIATGRIANPLLMWSDCPKSRLFYTGISIAGQFRRFHRYYPLSTHRKASTNE